MAYEHKPGTFSLFKNDDKQADNHPDYRGPGKDLDGNDIEVAAWLKAGKNGKFMSCTFKVKEQRRAPTPSGNTVNDLEDDIPF